MRKVLSWTTMAVAIWIVVQLSILFHLPSIQPCQMGGETSIISALEESVANVLSHHQQSKNSQERRPKSPTRPKDQPKKSPTKASPPSKSVETKDDHDSSLTDWVSIMKKHGLVRSAKQQTRFQERRWFLESQFPNRTDHRFSFMTCWYSAIAIDDEFAYRHIWKNGGTTIHLQTRKHQGRLKDPHIRDLRWMTLVRDPINHFLSGWSECGAREEEEYSPSKSVDERVYNYLQNKIIPMADILRGEPGDAYCGECALHSMPQANFLMGWRELTGLVSPQLEFVGAMKELEGVLGMLGFEYDPTRKKGRVYADDNDLKEKFPRDISLLSDKTLRAICDFVAVDYFLWDYEPPEACRDVPSLQVKEDLTEVDWKPLWTQYQKKKRKVKKPRKNLQEIETKD